MNRPPEALSLPQAKRIDALCDGFEAAWKAGESPQLEQFVSQSPASEQALVLQALLAVELELHRRAGREVFPHDYTARFPHLAVAVREAFQEADTLVEAQAALNTPVTQSANSSTSGRPERFDHFEVLEILGQGGFGTVYRARDTKLGREVAIKAPRSDQHLKLATWSDFNARPAPWRPCTIRTFAACTKPACARGGPTS